jgi:signal transduction histidine kinase
MSQEESFGDRPFLNRLLDAQVSGVNWSVLSSLVVEAWIRLGGASAAVLISPIGADRLQIECCRGVNGLTAEVTTETIVRPYSVLLDQGDLIQAVAETGLVGGLNLMVYLWPDLAAAAIIQFPRAQEPAFETQQTTLISTSRSLLSRANDRAVLLPRADLLEAMAEFAAGAGHEINNPLGSILGQTQILLKSEKAPDRKQAFETIGAQAWRIRDMIGNSMLFARPTQPRKEVIDLADLVQNTLASFDSIASASGVELLFATTADEINVLADRGQMNTLVSQLVRNSIESLRGADREGYVSLTLRDQLPSAVELSVVDDGPGITANETRQHLFNPFYSGRSAGRGLGFGLCLAWQIVRNHSGLIVHETPIDGGAALHVAIPRQ